MSLQLKKSCLTHTPVCCWGYAADTPSIEEAEDVLQEGFVKIFLNIKEFKGEGSIVAWMRRIMINTAITHYHKMKKHRYHDDLDEVKETRFDDYQWDESEFTREELYKVIQQDARRLQDGI